MPRQRRPKTGWLHLRVTPETRELLERAAERADVSLSRYVGEAAVGQAASDLSLSEPSPPLPEKD